ncbi:MAG: putative protease [Candidatus Aminicenantes bacterium]|nr:putative protease [Candidatus Aminicenantes bacterium]
MDKTRPAARFVFFSATFLFPIRSRPLSYDFPDVSGSQNRSPPSVFWHRIPPCEGVWLIEGHGVDPDIVVDNLPHATFTGKDAQLEAAVKHLLELIAKDPVDVPKPPPYPDKRK